ncbi:hypothetical protein CHS0354_006560 [Potamilus streckersoni]|uniref:Uncharacterized protein n=1 Tax=Potamilus streckersoni TaxID=2493646 RepID=A0AAE0TD13_9BIVA|nr:hypothetical protein CHS0354_006560 [Potamilus streckersoni]
MVNEVDNGKRTLEHYAAQSSNVSVLQCLIDKGLNPCCRTAAQETLLHISCIYGQLEMTQYLLEKYPDMINEFDNGERTSTHNSVYGVYVSVLQNLLDKGLNPWRRSATQETLLHMSCISGQLEMTRYLFQKYRDIINEADNGTPAHDAAEIGNVTVFQYLIDKDLNPWCGTATKQILVHRSCNAGQLEKSQYLLDQ